MLIRIIGSRTKRNERTKNIVLVRHGNKNLKHIYLSNDPRGTCKSTSYPTSALMRWAPQVRHMLTHFRFSGQDNKYSRYFYQNYLSQSFRLNF